MSNRFGNVRGSSRREKWGNAIEVADGLFRIRLDNFVSPLMVNTYAYRGGGQLIVIDPGWPWTLDALEQSLVDLGLARSFRDVDAWLYTHTHVDHMGPAALLTEVSDAPHYAYEAVAPFVEEWHRFQDAVTDWTAWGYEAFEVREVAEELAARTIQRRRGGYEFLVEAHGERALHNFRPVAFGEEFRVADLHLRFLDARGHDPYHGAFFELAHGWLFAGDVVIATPTPLSAPMNDDVDLYMQSLDRLEALPTTLLLPGHGVQRGGDLTSTFARSRGYQTQYRADTLRLLEEAPEPLGIVGLGLRSTPDGKPYESPARWLVHLALFDSHLRCLVRDGLVVQEDGPRYRRI